MGKYLKKYSYLALQQSLIGNVWQGFLKHHYDELKYYVTVYIFIRRTNFQQFCSIFIQDTVIQKHVCCTACMIDWWTVEQVCSNIPLKWIPWTSVYILYRLKWWMTWHWSNSIYNILSLWTDKQKSACKHHLDMIEKINVWTSIFICQVAYSFLLYNQLNLIFLSRSGCV